MADKRESEMTKVSDGTYIRGLDAQGNSILISKVDLIELIRANMPVATNSKNGLMPKEDARLVFHGAGPYSCNNFKTIGQKISAHNWADAPKWGYGELTVGGYSGDWYYQIMRYSEGVYTEFVRTFYNGNTWTEWNLLV